MGQKRGARSWIEGPLQGVKRENLAGDWCYNILLLHVVMDGTALWAYHAIIDETFPRAVPNGVPKKPACGIFSSC